MTFLKNYTDWLLFLPSQQYSCFIIAVFMIVIPQIFLVIVIFKSKGHKNEDFYI